MEDESTSLPHTDGVDPRFVCLHSPESGVVLIGMQDPLNGLSIGAHYSPEDAVEIAGMILGNVNRLTGAEWVIERSAD